jgi:hypothetical protein
MMCLDVNSDNKKDAESQCLTFRFYCGDSRPCDNSEYVHKKGGIGSDQRNRQQPHGSPYLHRQHLQAGQGPDLVSALTGHVEGSRAFTRYRTIDIDMKKDLVKILEGKQ